MAICKHCGSVTEGNKQYCSVDHMRRHKTPERFRECLWCKTPFFAYDGKKIYCTASCAHKHQGEQVYQEKKPMILQAIKEGEKPKHIAKEQSTILKVVGRVCKEEGIDYKSICTREIYRQKKRANERKVMDRGQVAQAIRMVRSGKRYRDIAEALDLPQHFITFSIRTVSKRFKTWKKSKIKHDYRKTYVKLNLMSDRDENSLCDEIESLLEKNKIQYKREAKVGKMKRRCDFLIVDGLFRYAVEAKISSRTKDTDTCIGQALISAHYLNAVPVCLFDSSIGIDSDAVSFCKSAVIHLCNEKNILSVLSISAKKDYNQTSVLVRETIKPCPHNEELFWRNERQKEFWEGIRDQKPSVHTLIQNGFSEKQISQLLGVPMSCIGGAV